MAPAYWLLAPLPPVRKVLTPSARLPPRAPPPAKDPRVSLSDKASSAPTVLSNDTATPSASAAPPCKVRRPAWTCTGPAKLLGPASVKLPLPCLTRPPLPLTVPA